MPNTHPLVRDFNMYYGGTYIASEGPDGLSVMHVSEVTSEGDERLIENLRFVGKAWDPSGNYLGVQTWTGDQMVPRIPRCGYYDLPGMGVVYVSYSIGNRTNRKGLDPKTVLVNNAGSRMNGQSIAILFNQCEFPGSFGRDVCVVNNKILWKGLEVGLLRSGEVTIWKDHEDSMEFICKLLQKHLTVQSRNVSPRTKTSQGV